MADQMITRQWDLQNRRLPHRCIGAQHHGQQVKTRLIYKHDGAFLLFGLFFPSGQRCRLSSSDPARLKRGEKGRTLAVKAKAFELLTVCHRGLFA